MVTLIQKLKGELVIMRQFEVMRLFEFLMMSKYRSQVLWPGYQVLQEVKFRSDMARIASYTYDKLVTLVQKLKAKLVMR